MEEEILCSESSGCSTIIEGDLNAKLGKGLIAGDPHKMSDNGRVLWDVTQRTNLSVVNMSDKCEGVITRKKVKSTGTEESVIDFIIVSSDLEPAVTKMIVDEERKDV